MTKIKAENYINLLKETFSKFIPYWESCIDYCGPDQGLTVQMIPFSEYALDIIKSKNSNEIKKLFDFVEFVLCNGDDDVQTAMTTSFLEYLMASDPDEIQFANFAKYLGKNTIDYCRAWDEFTGVKTVGLW